MWWVEERIAEAIAQGQFENLSGKGKPIRWEENPFTPPEMRLAFHLLHSHGFTLPWIEMQQELLAEKEKLRQRIARLQQLSPSGSELWREREKAQLEAQIRELNQRIRRYNIQVPLMRFQLPILDPEAELEGIR
ncbi:MAG: DUF1992 domain-containing protein [Anaerolineales bacterium]|nr:DUF1992 domain-containing protein [Anaerolineales bacterium]MDW8162652.1 DUF1992 domain-containing protein [Anaerolineales bacterium]